MCARMPGIEAKVPESSDVLWSAKAMTSRHLRFLSSGSLGYLVWGALPLAILAVSLILIRGISHSGKARTAELSPIRVACLGRIEPQDGVRVIAARSLSGQPSLVGELTAAEGESVAAGQIVAMLNSKNELEARYQLAQASVELARRKLDQTRAGPKSADIAAQNAEIGRIEAQLFNLKAEYARTKLLYDQQIVVKSDLELRESQVSSTQELLNEARERLRSLSEVRPSDVAVAEAELAARLADAKRAFAEYQAAFVRSPITGRVIKINTRPGEEVGDKGIMEIGNVARMYVVAEVPDTSISQVKQGYKATIMIDGLTEIMHGQVEQVGFRVMKNQILYTDPAALADARVVEAKVLLDDGKIAENLIYAQVRVVIEP